MNILFMTNLEKIIRKYLDLVIISFGILRKDLKKPVSVHWLKKKIIPITIISNGLSSTKIFCVSLNYKAIIWTRDNKPHSCKICIYHPRTKEDIN